MIHARNLHLAVAPVHAMNPTDINTSLCGQGHLYSFRDGHKYQTLYEVEKPITCKGCIKAMEVATRLMLRDLDHIQLERIINFITILRKEKNGKHTS